MTGQLTLASLPPRGTFVVTKHGEVGLFLPRQPWSYLADVMVANNVTVARLITNLRVATAEEVAAAGLSGVGGLTLEDLAPRRTTRTRRFKRPGRTLVKEDDR
jgi:hypothetical protein